MGPNVCGNISLGATSAPSVTIVVTRTSNIVAAFCLVVGVGYESAPTLAKGPDVSTRTASHPTSRGTLGSDANVGFSTREYG